MKTADLEIRANIQGCEKLLIGLGEEWNAQKRPEVKQAYESLYQLIKDKDYFIVTTVTDGEIFQSSLDAGRIVAPCGNQNWRQCRDACTKDIWEEGEVEDGLCPHCKAPLVANTIEAETYIEEGYLPKWQIYTQWLTKTLNRQLVILELGVGFQTPTVIRWPFEKTAFFNKKAFLYRVHEKLAMISEELNGKAMTVHENSVDWLEELSKD
ncbi:MAG: hypothetical protein ACLTKI_06340 [Lachnospiraceae bacterium]